MNNARKFVSESWNSVVGEYVFGDQRSVLAKLTLLWRKSWEQTNAPVAPNLVNSNRWKRTLRSYSYLELQVYALCKRYWKKLAKITLQMQLRKQCTIICMHKWSLECRHCRRGKTKIHLKTETNPNYANAFSPSSPRGFLLLRPCESKALPLFSLAARSSGYLGSFRPSLASLQCHHCHLGGGYWGSH